jgi:poly(beta-D-mannuronate) lyase
MNSRSFAAIFLLAHCVPLCLAEKDPNARAIVANPSASFLDVSARRAELAHATTPRVLEALSWKSGCVNSDQPAPPIGRMIIPHHYLIGSNGSINPQENIATAPYRKLGDAVSDGASRYVVTGDSKEAVCVANLLAKWAAANSLLDYSYQESSQAWYQVEWTLSSISLSWSVVQTDPAIPPAQRAAIVAWMHKVTEFMFDQDPHPGDSAHENNHAYWRALCATSVGILTSDDKLYRRGLSQYFRAIGQINPDGSLPLESATRTDTPEPPAAPGSGPARCTAACSAAARRRCLSPSRCREPAGTDSRRLCRAAACPGCLMRRTKRPRMVRI